MGEYYLIFENVNFYLFKRIVFSAIWFLSLKKLTENDSAETKSTESISFSEIKLAQVN